MTKRKRQKTKNPKYYPTTRTKQKNTQILENTKNIYKY